MRTLPVAKDQVNFPSLGSKVGCEEFQANPLQMLFGRPLA